MIIKEFISEAKSILAPILGEPGSILYSAASTLKKGEYYFLGLNPGGEDGESLEESLNALTTKTLNAYVDERWENRRGKFNPGEHPLQQNARYLFDLLGSRIEDVCSSNLIFTRSRNEEKAGYPEKAEICWPVHEMILEIVKPTVLITFGIKTFIFIKDKLKAESMPERLSGHGNWKCREARTDKIRIIGLPHLSRYNLQGKNEVISWILAH